MGSQAGREASIFDSAVKGDTTILDRANIAKYGESSYLSHTPSLGNNIIHIAARRGKTTFVDAAIRLFPDLLWQKNNNDNTVVHEAAAEMGTKDCVRLLISYLKSSMSSSTTSSVSDHNRSNATAIAVPFLLERNCDGETPFHVALRCRNLAAAEELFADVKTHQQILLIKNNSGETPLHLYARYCAGGTFPKDLEHDDNHNVVDKPKFIDALIISNSAAIFEQDSDGFIPVMRAAQYGRVFAVLRMLLSYKQSTECRDLKGMNVLHHLRLRIADLNARDKDYTFWICEKILELHGVDTLIFLQDKDGNTPLHLAIMDRDYDIAELILKRYVEAYLKERKELIVSIKNKEGKTVLDLITFVPDIPITLRKLMEQSSMGCMMPEELYEAAKMGYVGVFGPQTSEVSNLSQETGSTTKNTQDDEYFLSQDVDGRNILHIALEHEREVFITTAIKSFPNLMYHKDSNGDTPLHIAARLRSNHSAYELLRESFHYWYANNRQSYDVTLRVPPWKVTNSRSNTPLHEAARTSNYSSLYTFIANCITPEIRSEAMSDVNEDGETVLHLIARYGQKLDAVLDHEHQHSLSVTEVLRESITSVYMRDRDGLTPILRAAHCGQIWVVARIGKMYPKSIYISDYKGKTVLHHLCSSALDVVNELEIVLQLWEQVSETFPNGDDLMFSQDHDGNTPLHLAIMAQNFRVVHYFIRYYIKVKSSLRNELMGLMNNDGKSIMNLITCGSDIPPNLKKLIKQASMETPMEDDIYEAATKGDINVINEHNRLQCQAYDGSNILHIAVRHRKLSLLMAVVEKNYLYHLIYWEDSKGDTPLHVAAGIQAPEALQFVEQCVKKWKPFYGLLPWTVRNMKGNTVLHEAARFCNYEVILSALKYATDINDVKLNQKIIKDVNDDGETVLHIIARYATYKAKDFLEKVSRELKSLVYMRDYEGFTPVLRAVQCGRLGVARLLVQRYPQSVEIADNKGRTILHHMRSLVVDLVDDLKDIVPVWKDILNYPEADNLRNAQDEDGNTPLHLSIADANVAKAKFLIERCLESTNKQELDINNNDGHTVYDLLSSRSHIPATKELQQLVSRSYVKERALVYDMMEDDLYNAAVKGDVQIFVKVPMDLESQPPTSVEAYFCRQTPGGSNIIHIALRHGSPKVKQFVKTALTHYPILSMRPDNNGDTPLHLAAKWKTGLSSVEVLIEASKCFINELGESDKAFYVAPWKVKNYKGNFPIHEALQSNNLKAAENLLGCDVEATSRVNDLGETPLHAFAKNGFAINNKKEAEKFVEKLIIAKTKEDESSNTASYIRDDEGLNQNAYNSAYIQDDEGLSQNAYNSAYIRDDEGLTPLLRAARSGRLEVVRAILTHCPQSAYLRDPWGRTFLHLLRFTGEDIDESLDGNFQKTGKELFVLREADSQRLVQDYEGNTPLHYAIKTQNSIAAIVLTQRCLEDEEHKELGLVNRDGQTVLDLLALHDVPSEIIQQIRKKLPKEVYLARSSYGIRNTETNQSANALSVVAALLATITFAAGLQVPGGFDSDDGSPVLLKNAVFAAFMVANTIAMCCSMLCLFLLLWVGIRKSHGSLMILDISIILLEFSFYLTMLAFTLGVFVVTLQKSLWLAVLVCVLSFITFLLTWKCSIKLVIKFVESVVAAGKKLASCCASKSADTEGACVGDNRTEK